MSERDRSTAPVTDQVRDQTGIYRYPYHAVSHWSRGTVTPIMRNLWRRAGGPWGRLAGAAAVGYAFVLRPSDGSGLAAILLLTVVTAFARMRRSMYAVPALVVAVKMGSVEWGLAVLGMLLGAHSWARRADRPDQLALRIHLALAALTGAPAKERFKRLETFNEAVNRIISTGRGHVASGAFRRMLVPDDRTIDPVPVWIRVDYQPRDHAYAVAGVWFSYPSSFHDADPAKRQAALEIIAAKLPKMADGNPPGLIGQWNTDLDYCYARVARPLPDWVDIDDLPELPWRDVVPLGAASPDSPLVVEVEGFPLALWNFDNDQVAADHGIAPEPNAIVIGPPGAFKTSAGRTMIVGLQRYLGARIWCIDGKREGAFAYLANQEGCRETADPQVGKQLVLDAHAEMEARYAVNDQRRREGGPKIRYRPIILLVDEGMSWLDQLAGDTGMDDLLFKLVDLARKGRTSRIGVVWLTQRPDVKGVAGAGTVGQMRDSLGLKLAGRGISETAARMIYGDSNGGLANLIPARPRARMGMMVGTDFQLIQLAFTPDPLDRRDPDLTVEWVDLAVDQQPAPPPGGQPDQPTTRGRVSTP